MTDPKPKALRDARQAQTALNKAETRSALEGSRRDMAVLRAQESGATYAEIQDATGLSTPRVTQVLRRAKDSTNATTN